MTNELDTNLKDRIAAGLRALVSAVPIAGGLLSEIVTEIIPGQRQERFAFFLQRLAVRLSDMEVELASMRLSDPSRIDFIETGSLQAVRAITNDRIEHIAEVVARGISSDDLNVIRRKRVLAILGELDDDEIAILTVYGKSYTGTVENVWDKLQRPDPVHLQSSVDDMDQNALYKIGQDHLLRVGLLERKYRNIKKGTLPEFDPSTGNFKASISISYIGRLLLREIGAMDLTA
jgi:hypothetical protein